MNPTGVQLMVEEARELHPVVFGEDPLMTDRDFRPQPLSSEAPSDADPKGLSARERAAFSDSIPVVEPEPSESSETTATPTAEKVIMPPKVRRPGTPPS